VYGHIIGIYIGVGRDGRKIGAGRREKGGEEKEQEKGSVC